MIRAPLRHDMGLREHIKLSLGIQGRFHTEAGSELNPREEEISQVVRKGRAFLTKEIAK